MRPSQENLKMTAENIYFELSEYFDNDTVLAKALVPYYGRSYYTIKRNLNTFAFCKSESTADFIKAASTLLAQIRNQKINARAVLLIGSHIDSVTLIEQAKKLVNLGINVIAPQTIIDNTYKQFWDYVQVDVNFADFVVIHELDNSELQSLKKLITLKEIIATTEMNDLITHAIKVSLKKCKYAIK